MGTCCSSSVLLEAERGQQLDEKLKAEAEQAKDALKILLLGTGETGKSTLFKQITRLYAAADPSISGGVDDYGEVVFNNLIVNAITLCEQSETLDEKYETRAKDPDVRAAKQRIKKLDALSTTVRTPGVVEDLKTMWSDQGIRRTLELKSKFSAPDNLEYFFERLDVIAAEGYQPSFEDIVRCRVRTTGVHELEFKIESSIASTMVRLVDVGGQRGERKKWMNQFDGVNAVLFMCGISSYDEMLFEDQSKNRVMEDLDVFEQITGYKWMEKTALVLFLNKRDLFEEKFSKVLMSEHLMEFKGKTVQDAYEFFTEQFKARCKVPGKKIYVHVTCALDTKNIEKVFGSVKDSILNEYAKMNFL